MQRKSVNHGEHGGTAKNESDNVIHDFRRVAVVKEMSLP